MKSVDSNVAKFLESLTIDEIGKFMSSIEAEDKELISTEQLKNISQIICKDSRI